MTTRPSKKLRQLVIARADDRCEYCLMPQAFVASTHQVDHVIAEKHGGKTESENLALSCMLCNLRKAADIASLDPDSGKLTPLFHPREMAWKEHFSLVESKIVGLTPVGQTTANFLQLNSTERIIERSALASAGIKLVVDVRKPR